MGIRFVVASLLLVGACTAAPPVALPPPQPSDVQFTDVTDSALGAEPTYALPRTLYGDLQSGVDTPGVALADVDGDGDLDLFIARSVSLPTAGAPNAALYLNDGSGHFTEATSASGLDLGGIAAHAPLFADLDNDGDQDLMLGCLSQIRVYANDGAGHFTDVTAESGIPQVEMSETSSLAANDLDGDGLLDVYVSRVLPTTLYLAQNPTPAVAIAGMRHQLLHNRGQLRFEDIAATTGTASLAFTWTSTSFDLDGDNAPDIWVGSDTMRVRQFMNPGVEGAPVDALYLNHGGDQFRDAATDLRIDLARSSMGAVFADIDLDGDVDLYVSDFGDNELYANRGNGRPMVDEAVARGVPCGHDQVTSNELVSWGSLFWDFNRDGYEDLYVVNGTVSVGDKAPATFEAAQRDCVYLNQQDGTFLDVSATSGIDQGSIVHQGRGVAHGDLDGDGDEDLVVAGYNDGFRVYRNDGDGSGNHWLRVSLEGNGHTSNRDAIGALVRLDVGGRTLRRQVVTSGSIGTSPARVVEFGLGSSVAASQLRVRWPDGLEDTIPVSHVDQTLHVIER